jgi:hypothetical protein
MSVKILKRLKVLKLIELAREDFQKDLLKNISPEILKTIDGGSSPVKAGKQIKYSESYIRQIEGKNLKGKKTKSRSTSIGANSPLKFNDKTRLSKKTKTTTSLASRYGKKKSPVNLRLTGELHKSMRTVKTEKGVEVYFDDDVVTKDGKRLSEVHNDGLGGMPERRLLPNRIGEEFNFNIWRRIKKAIEDAIRKAL